VPVVDPYRVLGLDPGTDRQAVRVAWMELVKALHPDRRGGDDPKVRAAAAHRLAEINAAYHDLTASWATLTDPVLAPPSPEERWPRETSIAVVAFRPLVFEYLLVAGGDLGDITDADEPLSLTIHVDGPPPGFCRLQLFPDAGGTVVSADSDQVDPAHVCRVLAAALTGLGIEAVALAT
jgi:hypothetical protein